MFYIDPWSCPEGLLCRTTPPPQGVTSLTRAMAASLPSLPHVLTPLLVFSGLPPDHLLVCESLPQALLETPGLNRDRRTPQE